MGCGSEHYTRENRGVPLLRLQIQLSNIAMRFPARLRQNRRNRLRQIQDAKLKARQEFRIKVIRLRRKVRDWKKEVGRVLVETRDLLLKQRADHTSVTSADWDRVTKGKHGKLHALYHKRFPRGKWPEEVPYLNMLALAEWQKTILPHGTWPKAVPPENFKALVAYLQKIWPREKWPKDVPYLDFKAPSQWFEKNWPRAKWPKSIPYLDFMARAQYYEERFPRAEWPDGVPYLDFKVLAEYVERQKAESPQQEQVRRLTAAVQNAPTHPEYITHLLRAYHKKTPLPHPPPGAEPVYVHLHEELHNRAVYKAEQEKKDEAIVALTHWPARFDQVKALIARSKVDLRSVTVKEWLEAAEGTDILTTDVEAAQRMEFSRMLEAGEVDGEMETKNLVRAYDEMRRVWVWR
ncbi:hypothetical protein BDW02DRAFT_264572 [Decorospora gaudefroyi]|uniref:Uncharacterized protein n=1 Tax=Decorospora gaudefroyi TaxID=184978 RepID=A0A6A5KJ83_9PLEO|nr:hypothetical protein BDW02DRAFT_264572 [Decorospora gaudefroyi]